MRTCAFPFMLEVYGWVCEGLRPCVSDGVSVCVCVRERERECVCKFDEARKRNLP